MKTLEDLFRDSLADIYDAENRLVIALPKIIKIATHDELKETLQIHCQETEGHVDKLETVFQVFDRKAKRKKCEAIVGLLSECAEIAEENRGSPTINAAIIGAVQKIEHYEIATYGCLRTWAELLGNEDATTLLQEVLDQEKAADKALTEIAVSICNPAAKTETDEEPEEIGVSRGYAKR